MKGIDLIAQFELTGKSIQHEPDFYAFCDVFWLEGNYSQRFADGLVKHFVDSWICTDTRVGHALYYFGDELVAYSYQSSRKSDENISFFSEEAAKRVRNFFIECLAETADPVDLPPIISPEYDINLNYNNRVVGGNND